MKKKDFNLATILNESFYNHILQLAQSDEKMKTKLDKIVNDWAFSHLAEAINMALQSQKK